MRSACEVEAMGALFCPWAHPVPALFLSVVSAPRPAWLGFLSLQIRFQSLSQSLLFTGASRYLLHYFHIESRESGESAWYFLSIVFYSWLPLLFLGQHRGKTLFLGLFSAFQILCTYARHALRKAWTLGTTYGSSPWVPSLRMFLCVIILTSRLRNRQITWQAHS